MTSTGIKNTLVVSAIAIAALVVAWFVFKIVFHLLAALITGIVVLGIALYVYFKFFRKGSSRSSETPEHPDTVTER